MLLMNGTDSMNAKRSTRRKQPWRDALIATTGLSVFAVAASLLWEAGHPEWAFALMFLAIWLLISVSWSNIDFTEESGSILARIVDKNFAQLHERVEQLERELSEIRDGSPMLAPGEHGRSGWA